MRMKDILTFVTSPDDAPAVRLARAIAAAHGAHLAVAAVGVMPSPTFGQSELGVGAAYARTMQAAHEAAAEVWSEAEGMLSGHPEVELRKLETPSNRLEDLAALYARHVDLVVVRQPGKRWGGANDDFLEGAVMGGGRPVLVAPPDCAAVAPGRRMVLAWDASREASRAAHDAIGMIPDGAAVCVVTVDAKARSGAFGDAPGQDICAHLSRHGLTVELRNLDSMSATVPEVLTQTVLDFDADLLVMGAYRHARLRQDLIGGVTRTLLRTCPVPLMMSH